MFEFFFVKRYSVDVKKSSHKSVSIPLTNIRNRNSWVESLPLPNMRNIKSWIESKSITIWKWTFPY